MYNYAKVLTRLARFPSQKCEETNQEYTLIIHAIEKNSVSWLADGQ